MLPRPLLLSQEGSLPRAALPPRKHLEVPWPRSQLCGECGHFPEMDHSWESLGGGAGGGVWLPPSLPQGGAHTTLGIRGRGHLDGCLGFGPSAYWPSGKPDPGLPKDRIP